MDLEIIMLNLLRKILNRKAKHHYISDIDVFLNKFDKTHNLSASQHAELEKHEKIFSLRDNKQPKKQLAKKQKTSPADFLDEA